MPKVTIEDFDDIVLHLKSLSNKQNVEGMAKFGITGPRLLGIPVPRLRSIAKQIGPNHAIAVRLWETRIHEAQILAAFVDEPLEVTEKQMDHWVNDLDAWDVCDAVCGNLFDKTPFAYRKAYEWSAMEKEFVKRAGFVMMAELAVHDKGNDDNTFTRFLPVIEVGASDDRNFVKKAVNWALRQIGKRNRNLNKIAIVTAERIAMQESGSAKWIAADAIRELKSKEVQARL